MSSIHLPLRPHLRKFLRVHLGENYFLSTSDPYGILLFHLLRWPVHDARKDEVLERYTQTLEVHLGSYAEKHGLKGLTSKTVYEFNNFAHEIMRAEFHGWVDVLTEEGHTERRAVEQWMAKYDLEEQDIAYETLLKSWRRFAADRKDAPRKRAPHQSPNRQLKELKKGLRKYAAEVRPAA